LLSQRNSSGGGSSESSSDGGEAAKGHQTQTNSKPMWKGKGKERIDVENPNPTKRQGQVHYQDNYGNIYIYDPSTGSFKDAPKKIND
jgi:hypothetical protein